jgi:hypothetical protein
MLDADQDGELYIITWVFSEINSILESQQSKIPSTMLQHRCESCGRGFREQKHLEDHFKSIGHAQRAHNSAAHKVCTQFRCCNCNREFAPENALMDHLRDKIHRVHPAHQIRNIPCGLCNKFFKSKQAAKDHKASLVHKPLCAPIQCIESNLCKKRFNTPSALILHLESGSCPSMLTRVKLNKIIAEHDTNHVITFQRALEAAGSCATSDSGGTILTPCSSPPCLGQSDSCNAFTTDWEVLSSVGDWEVLSLDEISLSFATSEDMYLKGDSIQGISCVIPSALFICPLCPPTSNRFRTVKDLQNHRESPVHAPNIFHCPTELSMSTTERASKPAARSFSTFSGLAMHIESGACGKQTFRWVLSLINERLKGLGIREIRLVS